MQGCPFCLLWGYFVYILMVYKVDSEIIGNKLQVLNVTLENYVDTLLKKLTRDRNSDILRDCVLLDVGYFLN